MSMSHALNDAFNNKKRVRSWYQKTKHIAGARDYQELEAEVYWHVLDQKLKDNPLLIAFKAVLAPKGIARSEHLDGCIRENKLSKAENAHELIQLTNGLIGLAHYKNLAPYNARVRFIAGILEACYIAMDASDFEKMNHWNTLKDLLESVKDSDLSNTWAVADQAKSRVGVSQSLTHYKTQLVAAVATLEHIILKEEIIQKKQSIRDDLKKLNCAMKQIPTVLPRFIYNLYAAAPVVTLDYHFFYLHQPEHMTSLVTVGIQQIIGLDNPAYNLCYEQGKLNGRGEKIHVLNSIIKTLGGKHEVKMDGSTPTVPHPDDSVAFLKTIRDMTQDRRLVLDESGNITIFDTKPDARGHQVELCRFPSGFSSEILYAGKDKNSPNDAQQRRQQVVLDYIDMFKLIQELQHCLQLNTHYAHYLSQAGELGVFAMRDPTLHEQMEHHNKEVAQALQTKMEEILTALATQMDSALDANSLANSSKGSYRRQAIKEARNVMHHMKNKVAAITQHADAISCKRKDTMQQMKDKKISFYSSTQQFLEQFSNFCRLQNLLGRKEVLGLSPETMAAMSHMAERLDDAIRSRPLAATASDSDEKDEYQPVMLSSSLDSLRPSVEGSDSDVRPRTASLNAVVQASNTKVTEEEKIPVLAPTLLMWTYPTDKSTAEKKWHYADSSPFKTARERLQYYDVANSIEEEKYNPAELLHAYLPKAAPETQKRSESSFDYQIRLRYDIASSLKNTMVYPLSFKKVLMRNHGRAARLVLCKEMLAVFENTLNNELLSEATLRKMSAQLTTHFKAQEEVFGGAFNIALKQLQTTLDISTHYAIPYHHKLMEINEWIDSGLKKATLDENLAQIQEYVSRLDGIGEYNLLKIKTRKTLEAYIIDGSVIAKRLDEINRQMSNYNSPDEILLLSEQLVSLKSTLQTERYSAIIWLPAGIRLIEKIDTALERSKCLLSQPANIVEKNPTVAIVSDVSAIPNTSEQVVAGTIGYETKRFVLSKFSADFMNATVFGENFTADDFFNKILEPIGIAIEKNPSCYDTMEQRIMAILKATSSQREEIPKIQREAAQLLDCLRVNYVATQYGKTHLSDLNNRLLSLPPFNTMLQRLKKNVDRYHAHTQSPAHAAESKEPEVDKTREQANTLAEAIKSETKKYIQSIQLTFKKNENYFFNKAYAIIVAENEKRDPQLKNMEDKIDLAIGEFCKDTPEIVNLMHIHIASEAYQTDPCQHTRDNLLFTVETVINVAIDSGSSTIRLKEYFKTLQRILCQLTTNNEDRAYLFTLSDQLNKVFEAQRLREIEAEKAGEHRLANKQIKKDAQMEADAVQSVLNPFMKLLGISHSNIHLLSSLTSIHSAAEIYRTAPVTRKYLLEIVEKAINEILANNRREKSSALEGIYGKALQEVLRTLLDSPLTQKERIDIVALFEQLDSYIATGQQQKEAEIPAKEQQTRENMRQPAVLKWAQNINPITLARTVPKTSDTELEEVKVDERRACYHQ